MARDYSHLFTPFKIGKMEVKNRIVLSPMGHNCALPSGAKSDWEIDYFEERARGGAGMICTGCPPLPHKIGQGPPAGFLESDVVLPSFTDLCERVHRWGSKICLQVTPGTGRNSYPNEFGDLPISASAIPLFFKPELKARPLEVEEIHDIVDKAAFAAGLAVDAGFDAI